MRLLQCLYKGIVLAAILVGFISPPILANSNLSAINSQPGHSPTDNKAPCCQIPKPDYFQHRQLRSLDWEMIENGTVFDPYLLSCIDFNQGKVFTESNQNSGGEIEEGSQDPWFLDVCFQYRYLNGQAYYYLSSTSHLHTLPFPLQPGWFFDVSSVEFRKIVLPKAWDLTDEEIFENLLAWSEQWGGRFGQEFLSEIFDSYGVQVDGGLPPFQGTSQAIPVQEGEVYAFNANGHIGMVQVVQTLIKNGNKTGFLNLNIIINPWDHEKLTQP